MVNSDFYLGVQASLFQAIDRKSRQRLHIYKEEVNYPDLNSDEF